MSSERYRVLALERGLRVLQAFSAQERELGASDVAARTGLPVPTVYRLLRTLQSTGFVDQNENGRFQPGHSVLSLGYSALQTSDVVEASREPLRRLALHTGETTNLGVRAADRVLYLTRFKTEHLVIANIASGSTLPLTRTSMGKLLLALQGESTTEISALMATQSRPGTPLGPNAITDAVSFGAELQRIREQGWAVQDQELAPGLRSVAVPVRDPRGVAGAINVAVDAQRVALTFLLEDLLPKLRDAAFEISIRLGYLDAVQ